MIPPSFYSPSSRFKNSPAMNIFQTQCQEPNKRPQKKLRSACDICHQAKIKCSGGTPCAGCQELGIQCMYSVSNRIGRPRGAKNKRTLDRISRHQANSEACSNADNKDDSEEGPPLAAMQSQWSTETSWESIIATQQSDDSIRTNSTRLDPMSVDTFEDNTSDGLSFLAGSKDFWSFSDPLSSCYNSIDPTDALSMKHTPTATNQGQTTWSSSSGSICASATEETPPYSYEGSVYISPASTLGEPGTDLDAFVLSGGKRNSEQVNSSVTPSSLLSISTCNCLQHHAELLCRLKDLKHTSLQIDVVLVGAQQALASWESLLQCRNCQQNDDQEVLLLLVMSIRVILRSLQSLCSDHNNKIDSTSVKDKSSRRQSTAADRRDSVKSTVGIYEITGEERMLVTNMLVSRTLSKIKVVLGCLQERSESARKKERTTTRRSLDVQMGNDGDSITEYGVDIDHLQQLLRNLEGTVQVLMQKGLRSSDSVTMHDLEL